MQSGGRAAWPSGYLGLSAVMALAVDSPLVGSTPKRPSKGVYLPTASGCE